MRRIAIMCAILLTATGNVLGQDPGSGWVLIPVYSSIGGAFGSQWETQLTIRNESDTALAFTPLRCEFPCLGLAEIPPRSTRHEDALHSSTPYDGCVIAADADLLPSVAFSLRVFDTSRNALSAGTEIPVVRYADLRDRVLLIDIPVDSRFRQSIRAYDLSVADGQTATVRLRVFPTDGDTVLLDTIVELLPRLDITTPAQVSINSFAAIHPEIAVTNRVRVQIDATKPGQKLWAFASVTNNETQEFTTVSPQ